MSTDPQNQDANQDVNSEESQSGDVQSSEAAAPAETVASSETETSSETESSSEAEASSETAASSEVEASSETESSDAATTSQASETPTLASGLDIGSGTAEAGDEEAAAHFEPTIRGKIDRFGVAWGTGRRKTAVARVRVKDGNGQFRVNGRDLEAYFVVERDLGQIRAPLNVTEMLGKVDIDVSVKGGGPTGQTGAVVLGIARALQAKNPALHSVLSEGGFLTRDSRMVERKKYGRKGARRSFQFSKR